jgi:hypothetical protein
MRRRAAGLGVVLGLVSLGLLVAGCGGERATPAAPSSSAQPRPPAGFPLLGSWATTITRDDLRAAGLTDPGVLNENSGRFTWTFEADGTWHVLQVSLDDAPVLNPVFSGTFLVEDHAILVVTAFPEQYRDAGIRYTWMLEPSGGVRFHMETPPDEIAPVIAETHAWEPVPA